MFFIKLSFPVDQLQKLSSCEENRLFQVMGHEVASVIFFVQKHLSLLLHVHWVFNAILLRFGLDLLEFSCDLIISNINPFLSSVVVLLKILNLLDFENNRDLQLIKFSHFFTLKISKFFLSFLKVGFNSSFFIFKTSSLVVQV